jgi:hypothetical protein
MFLGSTWSKKLKNISKRTSISSSHMHLVFCNFRQLRKPLTVIGKEATFNSFTRSLDPFKALSFHCGMFGTIIDQNVAKYMVNGSS